MFNVYKLTHRLTGEVYIGAASNLRRRLQSRFNTTSSRDAETFSGNLVYWAAEVLHVASTAAEAAQLEAEEIAKVPVNRRLAALWNAGAGLKDDATTESFPHPLGHVDLFELTHPRNRVPDEQRRAAEDKRLAILTSRTNSLTTVEKTMINDQICKNDLIAQRLLNTAFRHLMPLRTSTTRVAQRKLRSRAMHIGRR